MDILKIKKDYLFHLKDKKELLVLYYIWMKEDKEKNISFSIKELVEYWGYSPHRDKGRINKNFKEILINLKKENIIYTNDDLNLINNNNQIKMILSNQNNLNDFFVTLTVDEINKLKKCIEINSSSKKIHIEKLLYLFLVIKSHMNFNSNSIPLCYLSIDKIVSITNFSKPTIEKYITILKDSNVIQKYNLGYFKNTNGHSVVIPTVYTLYPMDTKLIKNNIRHILYNFKSWGEDVI